MSDREPEVAIVGGGVAGSALAVHLARAGRDVVILERSPAPRWRACGVFSATALRHIAALGLPPGEPERLARPIEALNLVSPGGSSIRLTYAGAAGFARPDLDAALLSLASAAGAEVRRCAAVAGVGLDAAHGVPEVRFGDPAGRGALRPRVVAGADGSRSIVARSAGVVRPPSMRTAVGLSYHVAQSPRLAASPRAEAAMIAFAGGYCGLAPVPGGRLNVGIVLDPRRWGPRLRAAGARAVAGEIVASLPRSAGDLELPRPADGAEPLDAVAGAFPLAHAVGRVAGPGWLLAGDAAGFLDPFTGEGLGRAFETATLAAETADAYLRGDRGALDRYDREVRARYAARDRLSRLVQQFLARPSLFDYATRRLGRRRRLRETLDGVLAERVPAERALDPRFLVALLRP